MLILGIDEVGRGSLAGPVVVGAVVLEHPIEGLRDSKQLSKNKRLVLTDIIHNQAKYYSLGWVSPRKIDEVGIIKSLSMASELAIKRLNFSVDKIIIDGNINFLSDYANTYTLIKGDSLVKEISAASIIAKTARDNFMISQSFSYPVYGFETNVGYGTKKHLAAIKQFGGSKIHRMTFEPIKSYLLAK